MANANVTLKSNIAIPNTRYLRIPEVDPACPNMPLYWQREVDLDIIYQIYNMDDLVVTKVKHKHPKRNARHTVPNELDESIRHVHKRRYSIPTNVENYDSYDETHVILMKTVDGIKKEVIVKKYKKVHIIEKQEEQESNDSHDHPILGILSKLVVKILCYLGILTCVAI